MTIGGVPIINKPWFSKIRGFHYGFHMTFQSQTLAQVKSGAQKCSTLGRWVSFLIPAPNKNQLKAVPSKHGIHEFQVSMEVSIVMANPLMEPDGLFHGKAYDFHWKMDENWRYPHDILDIDPSDSCHPMSSIWILGESTHQEWISRIYGCLMGI